MVVQHIEIKDATGALGPTPGTPVSAILVPWNPDDSWKRDALLRVNAVLGPPTRTHTVYEHLDVMVHPLGINLVESIAQSFWVGTPLRPSCKHESANSTEVASQPGELSFPGPSK